MFRCPTLGSGVGEEVWSAKVYLAEEQVSVGFVALLLRHPLPPVGPAGHCSHVHVGLGAGRAPAKQASLVATTESRAHGVTARQQVSQGLVHRAFLACFPMSGGSCNQQEEEIPVVGAATTTNSERGFRMSRGTQDAT